MSECVAIMLPGEGGQDVPWLCVRGCICGHSRGCILLCFNGVCGGWRCTPCLHVEVCSVFTCGWVGVWGVRCAHRLHVGVGGGGGGLRTACHFVTLLCGTCVVHVYM